MRFADVIAVAFGQIVENKLRSFFTLVGIIVSVTFLIAVVAIISGMNAYVSENLAGGGHKQISGMLRLPTLRCWPQSLNSSSGRLDATSSGATG